MERLDYKLKRTREMQINIRPRYKEGIDPEIDLTEVDQDTIVTIPNEALTIQEIFERSNAGYIFDRGDTTTNEIEDDDLDAIDLEEFGRLDIVEQHQLIHEHKEFLREMNKAHKKAMDEAEEKKKEAASANDSEKESKAEN